MAKTTIPGGYIQDNSVGIDALMERMDNISKQMEVVLYLLLVPL